MRTQQNKFSTNWNPHHEIASQKHFHVYHQHAHTHTHAHKTRITFQSYEQHKYPTSIWPCLFEDCIKLQNLPQQLLLCTRLIPDFASCIECAIKIMTQWMENTKLTKKQQNLGRPAKHNAKNLNKHTTAANPMMQIRGRKPKKTHSQTTTHQ